MFSDMNSIGANVFEHLEDIPWVELGGGTENTGQIPVALQELLSTDLSTWVRALEFLREAIDQGAIYEVTPPALDVLCNLVGCDYLLPAACAQILVLIGDIGADAVAWAQGAPPPWTMSTEEYRVWQAHGARCIEIIAEQFGNANGLLTDGHWETRAGACFVLRTLVKWNPILCSAPVSALSSAAQNDGQHVVRAGAILSLRGIAHLTPIRGLFLDALSTSEDLVRLCAAMISVEDASNPPPEAISVLSKSLRHPETVDALLEGEDAAVAQWHASCLGEKYNELSALSGDTGSNGTKRVFFPWIRGRLFHEVVRCACRLDRSYSEQIMPTMAVAIQFDQGGATDPRFITMPILEYAFRTSIGRERRAADLTDGQRAIVRSIIQNSAIWSPPHVLLRTLVSKLGLPSFDNLDSWARLAE